MLSSYFELFSRLRALKLLRVVRSLMKCGDAYRERFSSPPELNDNINENIINSISPLQNKKLSRSSTNANEGNERVAFKHLTMETTMGSRVRGKSFIPRSSKCLFFLLSFQLCIGKMFCGVGEVKKVFLLFFPFLLPCRTKKRLTGWGIFRIWKREGNERKNWKIFMMLMVSGAPWFRLNILRIGCTLNPGVAL